VCVSRVAEASDETLVIWCGDGIEEGRGASAACGGGASVQRLCCCLCSHMWSTWNATMLNGACRAEQWCRSALGSAHLCPPLRLRCRIDVRSEYGLVPSRNTLRAVEWSVGVRRY